MLTALILAYVAGLLITPAIIGRVDRDVMAEPMNAWTMVGVSILWPAAWPFIGLLALICLIYDAANAE